MPRGELLALITPHAPAGNVNDVTQGHGLLHGKESIVFADAAYQRCHQAP